MSKKNSNNVTSRPSKDAPELLDLATDVVAFHRKWPTRKLAKALKITKSALNQHVDKKKEGNI